VDSLRKGNGVVAKAVPYNPQPTTLIDWALSFVISPPAPITRSPKSPPSVKHNRSFSSPRLETIPEDVDFGPSHPIRRSSTSPQKPSNSNKPPPLLRIPGVGLVIRIGDLATLPMRTVLYYLLSKRIYSSRLSSPT